MKKRYLSVILISIFLLGILAACGSNDKASEDQDKTSDNGEKTEDTTDTEEKDQEELKVDKGLFNVEVTLPELFFESEEELDETLENAETEDGILEATKNDDGSITYKMSKAKHKEMMDEIEESINETIDELISSEDFTSIQEANVDSSFTHFTLIVDREMYEDGFDGFATLTFGISGLLYQVFDGVSPDDYHVTITVEDASTGEAFSTIEYPEALEELEDLE